MDKPLICNINLRWNTEGHDLTEAERENLLLLGMDKVIHDMEEGCREGELDTSIFRWCEDTGKDHDEEISIRGWWTRKTT